MGEEKVKVCVEIVAEKKDAELALYLADMAKQAIRDLDKLLEYAKENKMSNEIIARLTTGKADKLGDLRGAVTELLKKATDIDVKPCGQ